MTNLVLPKIQEPFIDPRTGAVSRTWWRFLNDLIIRVGGGASVDLTDIIRLLTDARARVSDLELSDDQIDPSIALIAMLIKRVGDLESQITGLAPVTAKKQDDLSPVSVPANQRRVSDLEMMVNQ